MLTVFILLLPVGAWGEEEPVSVNAPAWCLILPGREEPLLDKKGSEGMPVAGLRKLPAVLTLCRAFDGGLISESTGMQVSPRSASIPGPTAFLEAGERIEAGELLKAAVMISAGDAIVTLGENAFGSESVFLNNIQVTLKELGVDRALTDCLGTGTLFSARDLCALGAAAVKSEHFCRWSGQYMEHIIHAGGRETELVNANRMIRSYSGCFGLMTGSQKEEGYTGVFAVKRQEVVYVAAVIGAKSSEVRFAAAGALFDYAFATYQPMRLTGAGEVVAPDWPVFCGDRSSVDLVAHEDASLLLMKQAGKVDRRLDVPDSLTAPLSKEEGVGSVVFTLDGEEVFTVPLYPAEDVISYSLLDMLRRISADYLRDAF
jgi:D-alanyl-D-alanine carboxypeptidase (penicillin-binding protein 5/6)